MMNYKRHPSPLSSPSRGEEREPLAKALRCWATQIDDTRRVGFPLPQGAYYTTVFWSGAMSKGGKKKLTHGVVSPPERGMYENPKPHESTSVSVPLVSHDCQVFYPSEQAPSVRAGRLQSGSGSRPPWRAGQRGGGARLDEPTGYGRASAATLLEQSPPAMAAGVYGV